MAKTKKSKKEINLSCNPNILKYDHTDGKIEADGNCQQITNVNPKCNEVKKDINRQKRLENSFANGSLWFIYKSGNETVTLLAKHYNL